MAFLFGCGTRSRLCAIVVVPSAFVNVGLAPDPSTTMLLCLCVCMCRCTSNLGKQPPITHFVLWKNKGALKNVVLCHKECIVKFIVKCGKGGGAPPPNERVLRDHGR